MGDSFYSKEGIDFLYFQRPGTAYNNPDAFGGKAKSMMGQTTKSNFFDKGKVMAKPLEMKT